MTKQLNQRDSTKFTVISDMLVRLLVLPSTRQLNHRDINQQANTIFF